MTRKWIKLHAVGYEDKTEKIKDIEEEMKRLGVQAVFSKAAEHDGFFGRSQIYIDTGDTDNADELKVPLVDSVEKIGKGKIKALRIIEPIWTYPNKYNANDPLRPDFFKPQTWFVMGKEIHSSRLLTFVSREMPEILKPAYAFAGLSLSQMLIPYVNNWLRTRQSISDIICSFSQFVIATNLSSLLNAGAGEVEQKRIDLFNQSRDNNGLMVIDKDTETFNNISAPLGSLDKLQAQVQEHQSGIAGIPLVKLFGITPSGLNASSESEIQVWDDWILSMQQNLFTPHLSRLLNMIQFSLFGEVDKGIGFTWIPLRTLDEEQAATVKKTEAETDAIYIDKGVISPYESRFRIAQQNDTPYMGLNLDEEIPIPGEEKQENIPEESSTKNTSEQATTAEAAKIAEPAKVADNTWPQK